MRARLLWAVGVLALLAARCGSTSVSVTAPTGSKCTVAATSSMGSAPATGGSGTIAVDTNRDCTWSASSAASWIAITSGTTGQGAGSVGFRVAPNPDPAARRGTVTVNDAQIAIAQEPLACQYTISPANASIASAGGAFTAHVDAHAGCTWTATSQSDWIAVSSGSPGNGAGTVNITVAANPGAPRSGTVSVAGQTITVAQSAVACDVTLTASSRSVDANSGTGTVGVNLPGSCSWTASTTASWITITAGTSGSGNGSVAYSFAANDGPARTGTLAIAGQVFTLSQAAGCKPSISPSSQALGPTGGTGSVAVSAASGCTWTATTANPDWLTITGGSTGSGAGSVAFSAAANSAAARTGTLTIAGQPFTVTEAAACSFSIAPTSQNADSAGGSGSTTVTAAAGCAWTATSNNPDWITITAGASGSGGGSVSFTVAANAGAARTGTLTIAGQAFTVNQAAFVAPCTYSISPSSQAVDAAGGGGTFALTTGASCAWTVASGMDWIVVTSPASGTGSTNITFTVSANPGPPRAGTIAVGGQTFTVNQAGS
jgi:hypothetical protein